VSSIVTSLTGGGGAGMAFHPQSTNILQPSTVAQANQQYANVNQGLTNQQGFLNAVQAQNGLGNQTSVFNQMQGVANGTGPNPAQAMLNQSTGQNVANQASLMAGQRGSGANAGLIARQAAQQGANTQQQAAGQAATLQANQSLNALNNMGALATNQANQQANATNAYTNSALNAQQNVLGGIGAQNNANVGMQSNINAVGGGLAGNVATQQGGLLGSAMGSLGSIGQLIPGGSSGYSDIANAGNANAITNGMPLAGGAGDATGLENASTMLAAQGGQVPQQLADGGSVPDSSTPLNAITAPTNGPQSNVGKSFMAQEDALGAPSDTPQAPMAAPKTASGGGGPGLGSLMGAGMSLGQKAFSGMNFSNAMSDLFAPMQTATEGISSAGSAAGAAAGSDAAGAGIGADVGGDIGAGVAEGAVAAAKGGKVPALLSPGETYIPPSKVKAVEKGANPLKEGERVPGKPKVLGNSYANDTYRTTLQSGGIVIPNSIMQSKDPAKGAADFVRAIQAKNHMSKCK
jgi:hypothetical protein